MVSGDTNYLSGLYHPFSWLFRSRSCRKALGDKASSSTSTADACIHRNCGCKTHFRLRCGKIPPQQIGQSIFVIHIKSGPNEKLTTFNIWQSYSAHTASCPSICCTAFNKSSRSIPENIEALHPMPQKMLKHLHDFGPRGCCTYDFMVYREMGSNSFNVYEWTVCVHIFKYINYIVCVCACCHAYKYTCSYTYAYACTYAHTHRYT